MAFAKPYGVTSKRITSQGREALLRHDSDSSAPRFDFRSSVDACPGHMSYPSDAVNDSRVKARGQVENREKVWTERAAAA
jgi:hypothetical protein